MNPGFFNAQFQFDVNSRGVSERGEFSGYGYGGTSAYDAIEPRGKRKQPSSVIIREDQHLQGQRRRQLMANAGDLKRNLSILGWMLRKHLDYVARMNYQPRTGDKKLDDDLRELMRWQSKPAQMDRGARHGREKYFRLCEARRVIDGDCGSIRLRSGQLQFIKGDLFDNPPTPSKRPGEEWESGIRVDAAGAPVSFGVWRRAAGGRTREFAREIAVERFIHYGFFDDAASDQVRGISPLTSAMNDLRDLYESVDYTKAKVKLSQLLGIKFTRDADSKAMTGNAMNGSGNDDDEDEPEAARPPIDWSKGVATFDLDEGEDVSLIESDNPSTQTVEFLKLVLMFGLKALDLPYSFFDESHSTFHGSRGAWLQYDRSCLDKRDDQIAMRETWTDWTHQRWVADGLLLLPSKYTVADLQYQWVPKGQPWWKPSEEVVGALKAVGGGFDNPFRVCEEYDRGTPYENIDRTIDAMAYAHDQGMERLGYPLRLSFEAEFPQIVVDPGANVDG